MQYKKPSGMKFTDLCIYIDNNIYRQDLNDLEKNTIFEYLCILANMLARQGKYFGKAQYYDDFSTYFASSVYFRLTNEKQFQYDEITGEPKLSRIKSVLNYMKHVAYLRKIEFEQEFYSQVLSQDMSNSEQGVVYATEYTFGDKLSESTDDISLTDFDLCLGDICRTTKNFLKTIPYKNNLMIWNNIYLSCLLTLINILTLSNRTIDRVNNLKYDIQNRPKAVENLYRDTPENLVILYHLDKSMRDYVWILVQEIKHLMSKDLSLSLHTYVPTNSATNAIAIADINLDEYTNYEE